MHLKCDRDGKTVMGEEIHNPSWQNLRVHARRKLALADFGSEAQHVFDANSISNMALIIIFRQHMLSLPWRVPTLRKLFEVSSMSSV